MLDSERKVNQFLVQYCRLLVGDIADERLAEQPLPGVNHPAWQVSHLAFSADRASSLLGAAKELPADWAALFGPAVQIYTATHPLNADLRRRQEFAKPIKIGSDVWVGGGAVICPGVKVGSKSVIGAGSVVTRDIPDGVFAAGNRCRVIREITE